MPDWVQTLAGYVFAGGAVYAGIRADLAGMKAQIEMLRESANRAHRRIDDMRG